MKAIELKENDLFIYDDYYCIAIRHPKYREMQGFILDGEHKGLYFVVPKDKEVSKFVFTGVIRLDD